jgi:two-component system C4-dicarboxylate transport sensor histidine kinase DctB
LKTTFLASQVVDEAVRLLRPLACKQGVAFINEIQVDAQIAGDERALVQALVNLGSNAIRACAGKPTTLTIRVGTGGEGKCRISVEDNGPGIPENLRRGIFRPFVTSQTDSNGHGLGLFIVRRAVVKLGGSIRVQTSSAGTTFHIDLPVHSHEAS